MDVVPCRWAELRSGSSLPLRGLRSLCSERSCSPSALSSAVALAEAGKTAIICSAVFPEFLWLATGGVGQFNDRVKVLLGRQIAAFPDLGACNRWRKQAKDYPLLDITVSDYLEKNATPQQREIGADLADLVVEERMEEGGEIQYGLCCDEK